MVAGLTESVLVIFAVFFDNHLSERGNEKNECKSNACFKNARCFGTGKSGDDYE